MSFHYHLIQPLLYPTAAGRPLISYSGQGWSSSSRPQGRLSLYMILLRKRISYQRVGRILASLWSRPPSERLTKKLFTRSTRRGALTYALISKSGYRVTFLPVYTRTNAPPPPQDVQARKRPNTEPIYTTVTSYGGFVRQGLVRPPGEYLVFWYVGQISENAVGLIKERKVYLNLRL